MVGSLKIKKGFTLIELLVVISIIGLLSSVAFAVTTNIRKKADYQRIYSEMIQIRTAAAMYRTDHNGNWPATMEGVARGNAFSGCDLSECLLEALVDGGYYPKTTITPPLNAEWPSMDNPDVVGGALVITDTLNPSGYVNGMSSCGSPDSSNVEYALRIRIENEYSGIIPNLYFAGSLIDPGNIKYACIEL